MPQPTKQPQKATAAAAILGWLLSLAAARGVPVDLGVLLRIDKVTLVRVAEGLLVTLSRPVVSGAAALMGLLSRAVLLLLAVILCATPSKREVVLQRVRALLKEQVEVAIRYCPTLRCACRHSRVRRTPFTAPLSRSPHRPVTRQSPLVPAPPQSPLSQLSPVTSCSLCADSPCACRRRPRLPSRSQSCRDVEACRMCWSLAPPELASRR